LGRDYLFVRNQAGEDLGGACVCKRRLLSSPPKNGSTQMGGAFFVAKSCEDLGADCVIAGDHLQSDWLSAEFLTRVCKRRLLSSPPKNGSTQMGGAFFVAKSCEDLGADCVIAGDHLQSEWLFEDCLTSVCKRRFLSSPQPIPLFVHFLNYSSWILILLVA